MVLWVWDLFRVLSRLVPPILPPILPQIFPKILPPAPPPTVRILTINRGLRSTHFLRRIARHRGERRSSGMSPNIQIWRGMNLIMQASSQAQECQPRTLQ